MLKDATSVRASRSSSRSPCHCSPYPVSSYDLMDVPQLHEPLAEYLIKRDHMVVLVGGEAIKKNRTLLDGRWDSHDTKNAANVADLISQ
jgi:hypothetical protein